MKAFYLLRNRVGIAVSGNDPDGEFLFMKLRDRQRLTADRTR